MCRMLEASILRRGWWPHGAFAQQLAACALAVTLAGTFTAHALEAPAGALPSPASSVVRGELGARLDSIAQAAGQQGFHGVVLVAKGNDEILVKGYGMANHATGARFTPSTVVQIGSCVKDFTKVAILQLVEAGRLRLTDPLDHFFQDVPADKRAITVEQVLEHRAGFPLAVGLDLEPLTRGQFLERLFARPLQFVPGTSEQYSNAGFALLAAVVEQLTGQAFDAYVDSAIFRPAGMRETGLLLPRFDPARLARGYVEDEDRGTMLDLPRLPDGHGWNLRGNGGHVSTVRDMRRFYQALGDSTLLRDRAHRAMVLPPDQPCVLAGSDLVCFFLYGRFPGNGVELLIASNHADWKGERLMRLLQPALGIAGPPDGGPRSLTGGKASATLPDTGQGRTVAAYLEAFNSGDPAVMQRFLQEHAEAGPDAPPMERRLKNYRRMFDDLGRVVVESAQQTTIALQVTVRGEQGMRATFYFQVSSTAPFALQGMHIEVGG